MASSAAASLTIGPFWMLASSATFTQPTQLGYGLSWGWTDNKLYNRKIADTIFYRDFTYRDMAKRGSHLSNYMGTAWTASRALKVPLKIMEDFKAGIVVAPPQPIPAFPDGGNGPQSSFKQHTS